MAPAAVRGLREFRDPVPAEELEWFGTNRRTCRVRPRAGLGGAGGRHRPRGRRACRPGWLGHRRSRWPNTVGPRLLITQKTPAELGPAGKLWTTRATRNLAATLERLRVDRQLEEALTHGADPLHLALVFGIDEKTAIRYGDAARQLPASETEEHHGSS
ncbi:hypothetical protein [Streptomyces nitrosporeus]|uniref:hypothetical protein n=1 Tax=Streptomyces nitrosporeus TaxID=28894 RepID=UPI0019A6EFF6|nr:hypothetical protein [Streptomyces nitrosporeus]GGY90963.1 hypothetical protein GCM10010327_22080 [Streptomyces nitrosporeus]